jgi:hypothetical protein
MINAYSTNPCPRSRGFCNIELTSFHWKDKNHPFPQGQPGGAPDMYNMVKQKIMIEKIAAGELIGFPRKCSYNCLYDS